MFEKEERFTIKDIDLDPETLAEIEANQPDEADEDDSLTEEDDDSFGEMGVELRDSSSKKEEKKEEEKSTDEDEEDDSASDDDKGEKLGEDEFDDQGFNKDGKTKDGRSKEDFTDGFDKNGFDPFGYDKDGKDKDGNTASDEDISEEETSNQGDALVFSDIVEGKTEVSIKTEDGEVSLKNVLEDWKNNQDWRVKNTQRSQELKADRKTFDQEKANWEQEALAYKGVLDKIQNDSEFLTQSDEWFGSKEENPIRKIFDTIKSSEESVANRQKLEAEEAEKYEREAQEQQDDELQQIIAMDSSYNTIDKVQSLFKTAQENKVSLLTAYGLQQTPILKEKLSTIEGEHKTAMAEKDGAIQKLEQELKTANEKIQKLQANPKLTEPDDELDDAKGADEETVEIGDDDDWDDIEKKHLKRISSKR